MIGYRKLMLELNMKHLPFLDADNTEHQELVSKFNQYNPSYPTRLANKLKSVDDLKSMIPAESSNEAVRVIHKSKNLTAYQIHGAEANEEHLKEKGKSACKSLGSSSWCFSKDDSDTFGSSEYGYDKPTYILHLHNEKGRFGKLAFIHKTDQLHDSNNKKLTSDDIADLAKSNPELHNVHELQGKHWFLTNSENRKRMWTRHKDYSKATGILDSKYVEEDIKHIDDPDVLHELSHHKEKFVRYNVSKNPNTRKEDVDRINNPTLLDKIKRILGK